MVTNQGFLGVNNKVLDCLQKRGYCSKPGATWPSGFWTARAMLPREQKLNIEAVIMLLHHIKAPQRLQLNPSDNHVSTKIHYRSLCNSWTERGYCSLTIHTYLSFHLRQILHSNYKTTVSFFNGHQQVTGMAFWQKLPMPSKTCMQSMTGMLLSQEFSCHTQELLYLREAMFTFAYNERYG